MRRLPRICRFEPPLAKRYRNWEPVLTPVSLKAEMERKRELAKIQGAMAERLKAVQVAKSLKSPVEIPLR